MEPLGLLALLALLVLLALALRSLGAWAWRRARLVRMVERLPGPLSVPLLGSLLPFAGAKREDIFEVYDRMTKRYWPILRMWVGTQPYINLSDAKDIEVILSSTVHIDKADLYKFARSWLGNGLLTSSGTKWHNRRKLLTPAFHFKILEQFIDIFAENSQILVQKLEKELSNSDGFDIYPYITLCTLDIICETAMGTQIHAQEDAHSEYVRAIYEISERMVGRVVRPWLHPDFIFARSSLGKSYLKNLSTLHAFTTKVIKERKETLNASNPSEDALEVRNEFGARQRLAFLDLLLEAARGGAELSDLDIREEVDTFMFEGHDTTAAGICWALFLLGRHPDVQDKVVEELEEIFQGSDRAPTMQDLAQMKYLERVIKETLRLYPSVPIVGRHVHQDVKIGKYTVPAGCDIAVLIYHVHHNPDYFPNPDKFDPDNFLPEKVQGRHPYAYIPFSAGPRNCIGQKFALLEMKSVLSALLRRFSFEALERPEDLKLLAELILRPSSGVRVRIARRAPP